MKVGKVAACAIGGGIIMLQIASTQGYININWDKIKKKAEKISDKVEEKVTGDGPKLMDKVRINIKYYLTFLSLYNLHSSLIKNFSLIYLLIIIFCTLLYINIIVLDHYNLPT